MSRTAKISKVNAAEYCKISLAEFENWVQAGFVRYTTHHTPLLEYKAFTYASLKHFIKVRQHLLSVEEIAKLYKIEEQLLRSAILGESLKARLVADTYYCDILEFCRWNTKRREKELAMSLITSQD